MVARKNTRPRRWAAKSPAALAFGQALKACRLRAHISQEDLAEKADMDRCYISLIELGKAAPTVTSIFKLAETLDVSVAYLMVIAERSLP